LRVSAKTAELSSALGSLQMLAERLRELSAHHDSVREEERARIAREVHDELGQALTALKMDLSALGMKFGEGNPEIKTRVQELRGTVDHTIQVVRDVATALRPATLDFGILPGVEGLVEEFQKRSGIHCTVKFLGTETHLAEDRSIVIFRILQESLTNISRHAGAKNVQITVGLDATNFHLEVKDDGCGFDVEAAGRRKTFGLLGIRERVIMLRGELSIRSSPGAGTEVSVSIPYQ
jgi:signal transduction histidine kinase